MSDYERIDSSLIKWQRGMSSLFKTIEDTTPAGEISDSSLEFKFDADSRKYMKSAPSPPSEPSWCLASLSHFQIGGPWPVWLEDSSKLLAHCLKTCQ